MNLFGKHFSDIYSQRIGVRFRWLLVFGLVFLFAGCGKRSNKTPEFARKIDALIGMPIDDSRITRQFYIEYNAQPDPGRRIWKGVEDVIWYEIYPGGTNSLFVFEETAKVLGVRGVVANKIGKGGGADAVAEPKDGAFQVFIPAANTMSLRKTLRYRYYQGDQWGDWKNLSFIHEMTPGTR